VNTRCAGYEYIDVFQTGTSKSGKTLAFSVRNRRSSDELGTIHWHGPWRQYVYNPADFTMYSAGCLRDVTVFLKGLNEDHRAGRLATGTRMVTP